MKKSNLGIAVVGAGRIGTLRARLAAKHPSVQFLAISDRDPARARALAEQAGADLHSGSNDEVISHPDVTAVIVSTPEQEVPLVPAGTKFSNRPRRNCVNRESNARWLISVPTFIVCVPCVQEKLSLYWKRLFNPACGQQKSAPTYAVGRA